MRWGGMGDLAYYFAASCCRELMRNQSLYHVDNSLSAGHNGTVLDVEHGDKETDMTHLINTAENFHRANAGVPADLERAAIIEAVTEGWSQECVQATAAKGIADDDRELVAETIEAAGLCLSVDEGCAAVVEWARERAE